ncbi:MAG: N-acetyltransferase [Succinivibrio sp.]|nr:N-acetyltransferase [Succinivibrio sp.]
MKNDFLSYVLLDELRDNTFEEIYDKAETLYRDGKISEADLKHIAMHVVGINQIFLQQGEHNYTVRQATLDDVDALVDMVGFWAQQGQNLPRKRNDIVRNIQSFAVCVKDRSVVGCACLYVYDSGLAEIRSLGVSPVVQKQGQGRAIVQFLLRRARKMMIDKVFVLTRSPEFFAKVGFSKTVKEQLPEKILKDCDNCPKRDSCDEIAFIYEVQAQNNIEFKQA